MGTLYSVEYTCNKDTTITSTTNNMDNGRCNKCKVEFKMKDLYRLNNFKYLNNHNNNNRNNNRDTLKLDKKQQQQQQEQVCNHIFCLSCIYQYIQSKTNNYMLKKRKKLPDCPICFVPLSPYDLYTLNTDEVFIKLLKSSVIADDDNNNKMNYMRNILIEDLFKCVPSSTVAIDQKVKNFLQWNNDNDKNHKNVNFYTLKMILKLLFQVEKQKIKDRTFYLIQTKLLNLLNEIIQKILYNNNHNHDNNNNFKYLNNNHKISLEIISTLLITYNLNGYLITYLQSSSILSDANTTEKVLFYKSIFSLLKTLSKDASLNLVFYLNYSNNSPTTNNKCYVEKRYNIVYLLKNMLPSIKFYIQSITDARSTIGKQGELYTLATYILYFSCQIIIQSKKYYHTNSSTNKNNNQNNNLKYLNNNSKDESKIIFYNNLHNNNNFKYLNNNHNYEQIKDTLKHNAFRCINLINNNPKIKTKHTYILQAKELNKKSTSSSSSSSKRLCRIRSELASLSTNLPPNIYVRVDTKQLDILRICIIGSKDTPYENGCYFFDMFLPEDYPEVPPKCHFLTTGKGTFRFNPNLYTNGKVCLSILGTWRGPGWDPKQSTVLQVLLSIQALVLTCHPITNEPGYENIDEDNDEVVDYYKLIRHGNIEYGMLDCMREEGIPYGFEYIIQAHFWINKEDIMKNIRELIHDDQTKKKNNHTKKNFKYLNDHHYHHRFYIGETSIKRKLSDTVTEIMTELNHLIPLKPEYYDSDDSDDDSDDDDIII